jgi:ribosome modulation factor
MATETPPRPTILIRTAVWIGGAFGRWQRHRAAARDDSFVEKWKAAWNEGCAAYQAGQSDKQVPYSRAPQKEAWLAGWAWAKQQERR